MKVAVWDTYVRKPDRKTLHFDILVEENTPKEQVYEYGKYYLRSIGLEQCTIDTENCQFCHIETVDPNTEKEILEKGYKIIFLEEIPEKLPSNPSRRDIILHIRAHYPLYRFADFSKHSIEELKKLLQALEQNNVLRVQGIDHLNLTVQDLATTIDFYRKVFGFEVLKWMPEYNGAIIGNEAIKLCIYERKEFSRKEKGGFNHFGINVKNFDVVEAHLKALGIPMPYGVVQWEKSRSIYIEDPNGYEIEISEKWGGDV